jgi:hypothetical protein
MNKKLNYFLNIKKNFKYILYLLVFIVIIFSIYIFIPKFFSYTPSLIQESLKKNSRINIKNISNIEYDFFPTPRLRLLGSELEFEGDFLEIKDAEINIILNPLSIINYKILDYNTLLVNGGSLNLEVSRANHLFNYIKKNQKKINFKKNKIILIREKKKLFEINESSTKFKTNKNTNQLNINGLFLDHKISFILENKPDSKFQILLKVPELDISTNILLENKNDFKKFQGFVKFEVLNNFLQFNLIKDKKIIINQGFVRSSLFNSAFEGNLSFKPYFSFSLESELNTLDINRLIKKIQQIYFSDNPLGVELIKKMEGSINFKNLFEGTLLFKNREILLQNFKVGKKNQILFDAKILEFGKKGKIKFNLSKNNKNKKNLSKNIELSGLLIPSSSKFIFERVIFGEEIFTAKKVKNYENKFNDEVIDNSIKNIFDDIKVNNFFKTF